MVGIHLFFLWTVRDQIAKGDPDFTVFYTAARILRSGQGPQLYDPVTQQAVQQEFATDPDLRHGPLPYVHPPFEALLFVPLTLLPYEQAFWVWSVVNLGMLGAIAVLLRRLLPQLRRITFCDTLMVLLAFFPVFANFHQGQDAILLLLLLVVGYRAFVKGEDFTAGCWWGVGIFKYHLILPLVVILVSWRGRKLLGGFLTTSCSAGLLSLLLVGWRGALSYPRYTWHIFSAPGYGRIPFRQLPNVAGLLAGWTASGNGSPILMLTVLVCSIALLGTVIRFRPAADRESLSPLGFASAVITALLVGYSTNTYDLSLLVLPAALSFECYLAQRSAPGARVLLPVAVLMISPLWFFLWMRWERIDLIAICLLWWLWALRKEILRIAAIGGAQPHSALMPGA